MVLVPEFVPQAFISMYLPAIYAGLIIGFIGSIAIAMKKEEIHNDWFDSELVSLEEVLENDASLLVAQYIDICDDIMEEIDLDLIISHLDDLQYKIKGGIDELKRYL